MVLIIVMVFITFETIVEWQKGSMNYKKKILDFSLLGICLGIPLFYHLVVTGDAFAAIKAQKFFVFNNSVGNILNPLHFISFMFSKSTHFFSYTNGIIDKLCIVVMFSLTYFIWRLPAKIFLVIYGVLIFCSGSNGGGGEVTRGLLF